MRRKIFTLSLTFLLAGILHSQAANDPYDRGDLFEIGNIVEIDGNLMWDWDGTRPGYFDIRDIFGGEFGKGELNGHVAFKDESIPSDLNDWVEWETASYVPLEKYRVVLSEELLSVVPQRQSTRVSLFAALDKTNLFTLVDSYVPNYDQSATIQMISAQERTLTNRVVAKRWRLEMTREPLRQFGIRIIELDAIQTTPITSSPQIAITNPVPGDILTSDQTISVGVEASAGEGIWRVDFFVDDELRDSRTNDFNFSWNKPEPGEHVLMTRIYDRLGTEAVAMVPVVVKDPDVQAHLSRPRIGAGYIHFDVDNGIFAKEQILYSSLDLKIWNAVKTNVFSGEPWTFSQPLPPGEARYYKLGNSDPPPLLPMP